jgi:hypothetical protein
VRFIQKRHLDHESRLGLGLGSGKTANLPLDTVGYLVSYQGVKQRVECMAELVLLKKNLAQQGAVKALIRQKEPLAKRLAHGQPAHSLRLQKLTAQGIGIEAPGPGDLTEVGSHGTLAGTHAAGDGNHRSLRLLRHYYPFPKASKPLQSNGPKGK